MFTEIDDRLRHEIRRYRLLFTCEQCCHFDEELELCSQGYPSRLHREEQPLREGKLVFCKLFEAS